MRPVNNKRGSKLNFNQLTSKSACTTSDVECLDVFLLLSVEDPARLVFELVANHDVVLLT